MSSLQLQILLKHIFDKDLQDVFFRFKPTDSELRLHIWFTVSDNKFHRSFGPSGDLVAHEYR